VVELIGIIAVVVFVFDASISLWRRGERQRAVIVGGCIIVFLIASRGHAVLVEMGIVQTPYFVSFSFSRS